jgi:hypothetical protein
LAVGNRRPSLVKMGQTACGELTRKRTTSAATPDLLAALDSFLQEHRRYGEPGCRDQSADVDVHRSAEAIRLRPEPPKTQGRSVMRQADLAALDRGTLTQARPLSLLAGWAETDVVSVLAHP